MQFQRSMSLPRGFGGQRPHPGIHQGPVPPPPRSDSMNALRNLMARRHRVRVSQSPLSSSLNLNISSQTNPNIVSFYTFFIFFIFRFISFLFVFFFFFFHLLNLIAIVIKQFENHEGSSDSTSPYTDSPTSSSQMPLSSPNYSTSPSYSPSHQNYMSPYVRPTNQQQTFHQQVSHYQGNLGSLANYVGIGDNSVRGSEASLGPTSPGPISPTLSQSIKERLFGSLGSVASLNSVSESPQLSPVFKSEAAKQIIKEMAKEKKSDTPKRRQVPKEKRRHYTVSSSKPMLDLEDAFSKMVHVNSLIFFSSVVFDFLWLCDLVLDSFEGFWFSNQRVITEEEEILETTIFVVVIFTFLSLFPTRKTPLAFIDLYRICKKCSYNNIQNSQRYVLLSKFRQKKSKTRKKFEKFIWIAKNQRIHLE